MRLSDNINNLYLKTKKSHRIKLLLFVFLIYSLGCHFTLQGSNPASRFLLTKAIVEDGKFYFPAENLEYLIEKYWLSPDYALIDDKIFSDKAPGLSFFIIPFFIIGKAVGQLLPFDFSPYSSYYPDNDVFAIISSQVGLALFAAIGIVRIYDVSRLLGISEKNAFLSSLVTAFATPYWVYASTLFPHVLAGVFLISSIYHLLKFRKEEKYRQLMLASFFSGFGIVIEYSLVLIVPWLSLLLLVPLQEISSYKKRIAPFLIYGVSTATFSLPLFMYNFINFGSITSSAYHFSHWADDIHFLNPVHEGAFVLLLSDSRGLFYFSPIVIIGLLGLYYTYKRHPEIIAIISSIIILIIIFYSKNWAPEGGAAFGPRYIVPIIPLIGLGYGTVFDGLKKDNWLLKDIIIGLTIWSFIIAYIGAFYTVLIFGSDNPIFDEAMEKVLTGQTNVPLFHVFPLGFLTTVLLLMILLLENISQPNSENQQLHDSFARQVYGGQLSRGSNKQRYHLLEGYLIFIVGNLLSFLLMFGLLSLVLSETYIKFWEQTNGRQFSYSLPLSELWLIVIFFIFTIHALWVLEKELEKQKYLTKYSNYIFNKLFKKEKSDV